MSPGWSTSWMEAANNAAVISNGVNTDCNIENVPFTTRCHGEYISFLWLFHFAKYEYLILVYGRFAKLIIYVRSYSGPEGGERHYTSKSKSRTNLECGRVEQSVSRLCHISCMEAIVEGIILHVMIL